MKHEYIIQSREIVLTPIYEVDIELMRNWRNASCSQTNFLTNSYIESEQQKLWYQKYLNKNNDMMFIVNDELTDKTMKIGMVGLYDIDFERRTAEFGRLLIGESSARGRGLGRVITSMLCEFGFNELNLDEIRLEVLAENTIAFAIYKRVGFLLKGRYYVDGKEVMKMSLIKENMKCV